MRYFFSILFLFLIFGCFAQLQTSGNISMADIKAEIGVSGSHSLADLFSAATGTFNSTYEGNHDRITNFYGYQHSGTNCNSISVFQVVGTSLDPCSDGSGIGTTIYNGTYTTVSNLYVNKATPYTNSNCTTVSGSFWYRDTISNTWYKWTGSEWARSSVTCTK